MKITKEYLRTIIQEELKTLTEFTQAANNVLNKNTASRFNTNNDPQKILPLRGFEDAARDIVGTQGTNNMDVQELINQQAPEIQILIKTKLGSSPALQDVRKFLAKKGNT